MRTVYLTLSSHILPFNSFIFNIASVCAAMSQSIYNTRCVRPNLSHRSHWPKRVTLFFVQREFYWYRLTVADILQFCNKVFKL